MDILPAIDLREGCCVRLIQGDYERQITYGDDPVVQAQDFEAAGAIWLHLVDLDGARRGELHNLEVLKAIREKTGLNIEAGGGIRTEESVKILLDAGINRVIIGTKALKEPKWFEKLIHRYPHKIVLGLDARGGRVATGGWLDTSEVTVEQMAKGVNDWPLAAVIYTDIARDGMLGGPDLDATGRLAQSCRVPIIASGGVGELTDIEQLARLPITGIIVGRALYEGKFSLTEALAAVRGL
ncbi:MAG: 1-(5-phosphoribosyl)-5-[(5-phosphoribosylamino)methylideneamino] imidazole-4-carboxamide isomerase [Phycisphaerae bacterium SM23_30]|nr:MAG: 1-(5-phosphoribosyl)-5-[(5-phosphoribosylamino)methylideneamino] imidazole-4-carboxamide isomerase [Phycisphaerae bacterium SM23_30]